MMEVVVTTGAVRRAELQSDHTFMQTPLAGVQTPLTQVDTPLMWL